MSNKFMHGSPVLIGGATTPGVPIPAELKKHIPEILQACRDFGLDFYPTVIQMLSHDEMSEVAAYGGFPVRYPHWKWGMEYEELQRGYMYGMHRIYEMVINCNPCYIYCLNSNTLLDNVTVIAHATGHNHFFKNNIYFKHTSNNMMNELANHGSRIRRYMSRWDKEKVTEFIDNVLRIETLIDNSKAWDTKEVRDPVVRDSRKYRHPRRLPLIKDRTYMDGWINPTNYIQREHDRIDKIEKAEDLGIFAQPEKDVFGWIKDNCNLKTWQADIMSMLYDEALYFSPQGLTKTANEGFASWVDYNIMAKQGYVGLGQEGHDHGIVEYSIHKMGVLGGKYSMNPYKLGFNLLCDIEERWNKGMFGSEWEDCDNMRERENWDKNLGLGKEKVFEIVKFYDDVNLINEFFTQEFCDKYEFFDWERQENGEYVVVSKDAKQIKRKLITKYTNRGLPDIRLADPNHLGRGIMLLEHQWEGRTLYKPYLQDTLKSLNFIVNKPVLLVTKNKNEDEVVYYCEGYGDNEVHELSRQQYQREFGLNSN